MALIAIPVAILKKQAAILGNKTGQRVTAFVETVGDYGDRLEHEFYLTVPSLGSYRYRLSNIIASEV